MNTLERLRKSYLHIIRSCKSPQDRLTWGSRFTGTRCSSMWLQPVRVRARDSSVLAIAESDAHDLIHHTTPDADCTLTRLCSGRILAHDCRVFIQMAQGGSCFSPLHEPVREFNVSGLAFHMKLHTSQDRRSHRPTSPTDTRGFASSIASPAGRLYLLLCCPLHIANLAVDITTLYSSMPPERASNSEQGQTESRSFTEDHWSAQRPYYLMKRLVFSPHQS